jgi:hypothetical protein
MTSTIWFVLGLSGTGKSSFGQEIASRNNWLHFEIDQGTPDGLEIFGFREGWSEFERKDSPSILIAQIRHSFENKQKNGAILTFPSTYILSAAQLAALRPEVKAFYLVGEPEFCLHTFLKREKSNGRNLPKRHWQKYNSKLLKTIANPDVMKYSIDVFTTTGIHKKFDELFTLATAI